MQEAVLDQLTQMYIFPDGTKAPAEVVDNVECILDILNIYNIRYDRDANNRRSLRYLHSANVGCQ